MDDQKLKSKKRKRKHRSAAGGAASLVKDRVNGDGGIAQTRDSRTPNGEKKHKKRRLEATAEDATFPESLVEGDHERAVEEMEPEFEGFEEQEGKMAEAVVENVVLQSGHGDLRNEESANDEDAAPDIPNAAHISLPTTGPEPTKFSELNLSQNTMKAIEGMGFEAMTEIQRRAISPLLTGVDVLGGKT